MRLKGIVFIKSFRFVVYVVERSSGFLNRYFLIAIVFRQMSENLFANPESLVLVFRNKFFSCYFCNMNFCSLFTLLISDFYLDALFSCDCNYFTVPFT